MLVFKLLLKGICWKILIGPAWKPAWASTKSELVGWFWRPWIFFIDAHAGFQTFIQGDCWKMLIGRVMLIVRPPLLILILPLDRRVMLVGPVMFIMFVLQTFLSTTSIGSPFSRSVCRNEAKLNQKENEALHILTYLD